MNQLKRKLAIGLGATCSGCDIAIVDLGEKLVDFFKSFDIVFWPTAQDQKLDDLRNMPDASIDVSFYHGSIANSENIEMAELLRKKSKMLIAFGACACHGGVPGLANITTTEKLFERVYKSTPSTSNEEATTPLEKTAIQGHTLTLPRKMDTVMCLSDVVEVDYYLPGCPPETELVEEALNAIVSDKLPPRGAVLAPDRILCDECPRKREEKKISKIHRHFEVTPDPEKCLLEQGMLCMGIVTRAGCGAKCIKANIPCRGCMGPTSAAKDQGAKAIAALASVIGLENEEQMSDEDVQKLIEQIKDPLGTFYMFSLPCSTLKRRVVTE